MKTNSFTNLLKSANTPLLEKSPLFFQNTFDRRNFNNSSTSRKGSTLTTKLGSDMSNPMLIRFEPFIPTYKITTSGKKNLPINQNFFQMETPRKKENSYEEINTFLFNKTTEKKNNIFHDTKYFIPKRNLTPNRRIDIVRKNIDYYPTKKSGHKINTFNSFSNNTITNVINYEVKKEKKTKFLKKKRLRSIVQKPSSKSKKAKKLDKTLIKIYLNQIIIKGISLQIFPLIKIPNEEEFIEILQRLVTQGHFFELDETSIMKKYPISQETMNKEKFKTYFHKATNEKKQILYLIESNQNEEDPYLILMNYYNEIKNTIIQIQKNFVGKKKGILNKEKCDILYKLVFSTNVITDIIIKYKPEEIKQMKVIKKKTIITNKKETFGHFECPFCNKQFNKGQGLGGHMSRHHPKQSEKYKEKMAIRNKREGRRKLLLDIRIKFFNMNEMNYKEMIKNSEKEKIHLFIKQHRGEYISFKKSELKKIKKELKIDQKEEEKKNMNN